MAAVARHVAHVAVVHVGVIHCLGLGDVGVGRFGRESKGPRLALGAYRAGRWKVDVRFGRFQTKARSVGQDYAVLGWMGIGRERTRLEGETIWE